MQFTDLEFRLLIFVRKTKALLLRASTVRAQQYLARKKASQRNDFDKLSRNFNSNYQTLKVFSSEKFVTSLWDDFNKRAEKSFLPSPSFSFLNDGTIMLTMFGGSSYETEVQYLEKNFKKTDLSRLLLEDYVGDPLIVNNKYITSFNSIRQLFLLSLYLKKVKLLPDSFSTVFEWGGGYGNMAKLLMRMSTKPMTYILTDTPLFCCLQWLYLSTVLGSKKVHLVTSTNDKIKKGKVNIIAVGILDSFTYQIKADLFISTWGLSESSKFSQDFVAKRKWFGAKHIFLGYQKNSQNLPTAEYIGELAKKSGATFETLKILPNNFLAMQ